jgi:hypothetical protein
MAEKAITFAKIASRTPSPIGKYGMIRCDGEMIAPHGHDSYNATRIERF